MDMLNESLEKFKTEEAKLKDMLKIAACEEIECMDSDTLKAIQAVFRFMDASTELIDQQTKTIYEMNNKLDKLLERKS